MAKLRLAYGKKANIEKSIDSGEIPPGTIILTEDTSELYFYNLDGVLGTYVEKYKFSSKEDAEEWIQRYNCRGEIISVRENNECNVYIVDYNNELQKFERSAPSFSQVQADWNETDPESPAYIKNKPDVSSGNDRHYVYTQISPSRIWDVNHNLNKHPSVTITDSSGSLVMGEVTYLDANRLMLTFTSAFSGTCYCN